MVVEAAFDPILLSRWPAAKKLIGFAFFLFCLSFISTHLNMGTVSFDKLTVLWPTNAFIVGVLFYKPKRQWPAYLLAAYGVDVSLNLYIHYTVQTSLLLSICNTIEILLAALPLYPILSPKPDLTRRNQMLAFALYGVILAPAVACFLGVLSTQSHFHLPTFADFYHWFAADAIGMATVTPLYLASQRKPMFAGRSWEEIAGLIGLLSIGTFVVFWQTHFPLLFVLLLLLLLVGVRLRLAGAALGVLLVSVIGGYLSAIGDGPFALMKSQSLSARDFVFQLFIAASMVMLYVIEVRIAENERLQAHLAGSERRFRLLAEASSDIIFLLGLDDYQRYVSPAVMRVLGWQPEGLAGGRFSDLLHPDDVSAVERLLEECRREETSHSVECRLRKSDESYTWIEIGARLFHDPDSGQPSGFVLVGRDIALRKLEEEERKRSFEMVERANAALIEARSAAMQANEAKSKFLSNMSHEIRTPLNGVLGILQLLLATELTAEQRRYVEVGQRSGETLLTLIDDVLDLSKIEAGRMEVENVDFDLRRTIEGSIEIWRIQAGAKGLRFDVHVSPETPALVRGDPNRLRQVLNNLAANAVKFTDKGSVVLNVSPMASLVEGVQVRFAMTDTGIGISPDRVNGLFTPFVQADPSTTRKYGGSGLGLSICRRLVELMGGSIAIERSDGGGSTFWFTVLFGSSLSSHAGGELRSMAVESGRREDQQNELRVPAMAGNSVSAAVVKRPAKGARVLVVEDNATNRAVAVALLDKLGYGAQVAVNGAEAVEVCKDQSFDLILMDCEMPVMDGYEATRKIRETHSLHVPIIAVTAQTMGGDRERCLQAGMDDFLSKPVNMKLLDAMLEKWSNPAGSPGSQPSPVADSDAEERLVFDPKALLERLEDMDFASSVVREFLDYIPGQVQTLQRQIDAGDYEGIRISAHTLKGASATISADHLSDIARQLETAASPGGLDRLRQLAGGLPKEVERLRSEVQRAGWISSMV